MDYCSVDIDKNALIWFLVFHLLFLYSTWLADQKNILSLDWRTTINRDKLILTHPKSEGSPLMMKNLETFLKAVSDSSKEVSWCTICNAKNPSPYQVWFQKNIEKNLKNISILIKMAQNSNFFKDLSWFGQKPYFVKSCIFLRWTQWIRTLHLSYQKQFFFKDFSL